jgi:hypothetical protein
MFMLPTCQMKIILRARECCCNCWKEKEPLKRSLMRLNMLSNYYQRQIQVMFGNILFIELIWKQEKVNKVGNELVVTDLNLHSSTSTIQG